MKKEIRSLMGQIGSGCGMDYPHEDEIEPGTAGSVFFFGFLKRHFCSVSKKDCVSIFSGDCSSLHEARIPISVSSR